MILLDTNVLSELMKAEPNRAVLSWAKECNEKTATTAVTLSEILAGIARLPQGHKQQGLLLSAEKVVQRFSRQRLILPFDEFASPHYAAVIARRYSRGLPISAPDAQIAAICRAHGARLATRNLKGFVETGIELFNPWGMG